MIQVENVKQQTMQNGSVSKKNNHVASSTAGVFCSRVECGATAAGRDSTPQRARSRIDTGAPQQNIARLRTAFGDEAPCETTIYHYFDNASGALWQIQATHGV
ncbi:hypothetical protein EVAR_31684_1 [Eumeta japonica]|uniref:Uncharacterized protein n=1 Tax=Eumeta variegata TaxID=151549 RepID=A0A4C1VT89_EUMVA|nr:hypothetical protein EVAR_31684_1 [Eumeta japonica]